MLDLAPLPFGRIARHPLIRPLTRPPSPRGGRETGPRVPLSPRALVMCVGQIEGVLLRRVASKAARSCAGALRREIWISSGLRGGASGLRESPGFGRLDLFGIPWILSSEMSLFNGLHATPGAFLIHAAPSPQSEAQDPAVIRSEGRRAEPHGPAETAGRAGIMAIDIARVGPGIGMKLTLSSLFGKKLSTQRPLTPKPSPPRKARRLVEWFEWHDTPKLRSRLDMVESELAAPLHPTPRPPHPR